MQNQVFNANELVGSESLSGRIKKIAIGSILALVLLAAIAIGFTGQRSLVTESEQPAEFERASSLPETVGSLQASSAPSTYTQRYWDLAGEHETGALVAVEPSSFSTQQYWDLAAERETGAPVVVEPSSFSTQQYWNLASEHAQGNNLEQSVNPVTYTQQYWDLAAQHAQRSLYKMSAAPRSEDAFYTERYWKMTK